MISSTRLSQGDEIARRDLNINKEIPHFARITNSVSRQSESLLSPSPDRLFQEDSQLSDRGLGSQQLSQIQIKEEYETLESESTGKEFKESVKKQKEFDIEENQLQRASKKISKPPLGNACSGERNWSKEEDAQILKLSQEHGCNWVKISKFLGGTRTPGEIRYRYINKLDPNIKKNAHWSAEEDEKLKNLFQLRGPKWRWISKLLPGRTEVMVKNRFYCKFQHLMDVQPIEESLQAETAKRIAQKNFIAQETSRLKNLLSKTHPGQLLRVPSLEARKSSHLKPHSISESPKKLQTTDNMAERVISSEGIEENGLSEA